MYEPNVPMYTHTHILTYKHTHKQTHMHIAHVIIEYVPSLALSTLATLCRLEYATSLCESAYMSAGTRAVRWLSLADAAALVCLSLLICSLVALLERSRFRVGGEVTLRCIPPSPASASWSSLSLSLRVKSIAALLRLAERVSDGLGAVDEGALAPLAVEHWVRNCSCTTACLPQFQSVFAQ